jgi:hypothetical protein
MIGFFSKKIDLGKSDGKQVFTLQVIEDATHIVHHDSTLHSKVRKMGYQDTRHIGILSNQVQVCQLKQLLEC